MAEYSNIWADGDDGGITADCKSVTLETLLVRIPPCQFSLLCRDRGSSAVKFCSAGSA